MIKIGDREIRWREGLTVTDILKELGDPYHYSVVRVNGRLVSFPNFENSLVPDNAEIFLIHLIAGG
jgi:thiamine biosynthesis protein ThiS